MTKVTQEELSVYDNQAFYVEVNCFIDVCVALGSTTHFSIAEDMVVRYGDDEPKLVVALQVLSAFLFIQNPSLLKPFEEAYDISNDMNPETKH